MASGLRLHLCCAMYTLQVRREKCANELVVRSRQQGALKVQKWLRGEAGRRLAAQKLSMLRAARVVQRTMR